jgi:hypothetical protein
MKSVKFRLFATVAAGLLSAFGCQGLMNQEAAVQRAIHDHLAARSDLAMDKMTMTMERVVVDGETAQADVVFAVTGDPQSRMSYHYDLRREGGRWLVEAGRPNASQLPHPQLGDSTDSSVGELPEGHPPLTGSNPHGEGPLPSEGSGP